jgi:hypothetical protein
VSPTDYWFDGVLYSHRNKEALVQRGLFNNLISTSRVLLGKPNKNTKHYLFEAEEGCLILTTDKYWNKLKTVKSYEGKRYDLLLVILEKYPEMYRDLFKV